MRALYRVIVLLLPGILAGCGLKGDLFLPPEPEAEPVIEAPVNGDPAANGEDESKDEENEDG